MRRVVLSDVNNQQILGPPTKVTLCATAAKIARIASRSSTVAINRRRPPHRGHASTSISKARRIESAHAQWRQAGSVIGSSLASANTLDATGTWAGGPA